MSTTPPSNMQMFRLATNRKFIKGVKSVMVELKKAGIDMNSQVRADLAVRFAFSQSPH